MKKLVTVLFVATLLFACDKDKEYDIVNPLVGKWQLVGVKARGKLSNVRGECEGKTTISFTGSKYADTNFFAMYIYQTDEYGICNFNTVMGDYTVKGDKITLLISDDETDTSASIVYRYAISDYRLTLKTKVKGAYITWVYEKDLSDL